MQKSSSTKPSQAKRNVISSNFMSLRKFATAVFINMGLMHSALFGNAPLVTFDSPIAAGTPAQNISADWSVANGTAAVVAGAGTAGSQALKINQGSLLEAVVTRNISWNSNEQTAFVDAQVKPVANAAGSAASIIINGSQIACQISADGSYGEIWTLHGADGVADASPAWHVSAQSFSLSPNSTASSEFVRFTVRQDYVRNVWDLFVNGKLAAANLRFHQRGTTLSSMQLYGATTADLYLDDVQAEPSNMLFADADKDGLPDAWELANGSNPNLYDRDAINATTGLSNLAAYLKSLWPASPNITGGAYIVPQGTIPALSLPPHTPVGALKGSFSVGGDGSASYSIPIDLPKGTSGMEPILSLGYSSNGGNGILGLGFSLSGLQSITRGPSSLKKDGKIDGVDFDVDDRFFLNGEKLVCVGGVYGADGSEYRTEIDSFSRIKLSGNANLGGGSSWSVQTKAGLTLQFGGTSDSKVMAVNTTAPLAWAVNQVSDTMQNYYSVIYTKDASANHEIINHRVVEIKYTGNTSSGTLPYCSVKFDYEARPDTSFAYIYGTKSVSTLRLNGIAVWTDTNVNHSYQLAYRTSQQSNRSLLYSVQKVVGQSVVPPTIIDWDAWTNADPALTASQMWVRSSTYGGTNLPQFYEYGGSQNDENGLVSHASLEDNNTVLHLTGNAWRGKAVAYTVTPNTKLSFDYKASATPRSEKVLIGLDNDLNVDSSHVFMLEGTQSGYNQTYRAPESMTPAKPNNAGSYGNWVTVTIPVGSHFTGAVSHLALINEDDVDTNGIGECYFRNIRIFEQGQTVSPLVFGSALWELPELVSSTWQDRGLNFVDINTDGLIDIVKNDVTAGSGHNVITNNRETYINNGSGWNTNDDTWLCPPAAYLSSHDGDDTDSRLSFMRAFASFSDYNGDGRPDLMMRKITNGVSPDLGIINFDAKINNGSGWSSNSVFAFPFTTHAQPGSSDTNKNRFRDWVESDLNGDGFVDLIANTRYGWIEGSALSPGNTSQSSYRVMTHKGILSSPTAWEANSNYLLPNPGIPGTTYANSPYLSDGINEDDIARGLMDLNGDGLPEFYTASSDLRKTFLNTGTGWDKKIVGAESLGSLPARLPQAIINSSGKPVGSRVIDLNGDGLPDFLRCQGSTGFLGFPSVDSTTLACFMNNGNTSGNTASSMFSSMTASVGQNWIPAYPLDLDSNGNDNYANEFADINGDGLVDLIFAAPTTNVAYLNTGTNFSTSIGYAFPSGIRFCQDSGQINDMRRDAQLMDVNGDGFPDILGKLKGNAPEVWINQSKTEKIKTITDGFGSDIQITYSRMNDATIQPGFGSRVYQKYSGVLPVGQVGIIDSRLVVSRYSAPDGLGARRYTSHRYGDLRFDRTSESSLGFAWAEVKDELSQQVTHTDYYQTFPYAGSPLFTKTTVLITAADIAAANAISPGLLAGVSPGEICLSEESATYGQMSTTFGIGGTIYRPVQTSAVKTQRDLNCQIKSQTTTTQNIAHFDAYGFLTQSTVVSLDGTTVITASTYNHTVNATSWLLGRLAGSAVTKTKGSESITKSSGFTYHPTTGLLLTETIEPGNALSVTKTYTYDTFGNITANSVIGSGQTRTSSTTYDSRGRFVINEANQLGHNVGYAYDPLRALLLSTTDINGLTTRFTYDPFGTLIRTYFPDGTQSGEATGIANNSVVPLGLTVPNQIKYFRASQKSGGPVGYVYLDAAGREILTTTTTLVDATATGAARYKQIYSHTSYDAKGRKIASSLPYAPGSPLLYTTIQYDALDRALKTTRPNGNIEKVDCYRQVTLAGQPVTYSCVTANGAQTLERWEDQHGRLIQSRDESGLTTNFIHNIEGNLISVNLGGTTLLTNTFDQFGNKTAVWEANSGTSSTTYNAFGEAITSTNALGQTTSYTYDVLGRPKTITRPNNEGTYTNTYDTAGGTAAKGKPSTITGPDGYAEAIIYDGLGRPTATAKSQFGETFTTTNTYDALGRTRTATDAGGLTTVTYYDSLYSIPVKTTIGTSAPGSAQHPGIGTTLWQAGTYDTSGRSLTQTLANGVTLNQAFDYATGNLTGLSSSGNGQNYQNKNYQWDINGNLTQRSSTQFTVPASTNNPIVTENFGYDAINRLTARTIGSATENYTYSTTGNLLTKPSAALSYNGTKPHQVTHATIKGAARTYTYDAAGYVTHDGKRSYAWTSFGQLAWLSYQAAPALHDLANNFQLAPPANIEQLFSFDAGGSRARQIKTRTALTTGAREYEVTDYLGTYEREVHSTAPDTTTTPVTTKTLHRHNLGAIVYTRAITTAGTSVKLTNVLADHLGSTDLLLTATWDQATKTFSIPTGERQAFDPWGERANPTTAQPYRQSDADPFRRSSTDYDRGYTGHEQLDDSGLIHMNGRLYDPELGRMLSADPYVQVPEYSQNFNRYSYVLNNPLNKTDPTGYSWLSNAFHKLGSWFKENWRTVVTIALGAILMLSPLGTMLAGNFLFGTLGLNGVALTTFNATIGAITGGIMGGVNAALAGGDLGDVLRGAAVGAVQGAISSGPLHEMEGAAKFGGKLAHVVGHGVTGGAANAAMGGKFQDGFLSAAAGAAAVHTGLYGAFEGSGPINVAGRTAIAGMIGGTASALGGGKFANGAYTSAFQHLLNNESGQPRGAWTKEQEIAELAKDGIELNWFERLMFKHEAVGNGMEHTANALGGLGDGASFGQAENLSKLIYGDEFVWADKNSKMYKTGEFGGERLRDMALGGIGGRVVKIVGPANRWTGNGSFLFGRGGQFGQKGIFNGKYLDGYVRLGWNWKGPRVGGSDTFRLAIGSTPSNAPAIIKKAINYLRHFDM